MNLLNWIGIIAVVFLAFAAAGHALLHKKDSRSALGWVGFCLLYPLVGPALYLLFGINRVRRIASRLRGKNTDNPKFHYDTVFPTDIPRHIFKQLEHVGHAVLGTELSPGNRVEPFFNGREAYPVMLDAIRNARRSVYLATYILDTDDVGSQFIDELERAVRRGVEVRTLVDGIGERYSWPRASKVLRKRGIPAASFLPPHLFPPELRINLRNHRKILLVDNTLGFTGGMNISAKNIDNKEPEIISDIHFRVHGPVIRQLWSCFADDWLFAAHEQLPAPDFSDAATGECYCRAVEEGPDNPEEPLKMLLTGVLSAATSSIRIMTPYFLPPHEILTALIAAQHKGVHVQIILPGKNNLPFVHWGSRHLLEDLVREGITVAFQPPPFRHTKLLMVDGCYVHLGSANMDYRSLRLNFELTLEVLNMPLAEKLEKFFRESMSRSQVLTMEKLQARRLPTRLLDAFCWLFSPYF